MRKPFPKIMRALAGVTANPLMKYMRDIAYAPIKLASRQLNNAEAISKAETKRLRKMERNKKNAVV